MGTWGTGLSSNDTFADIYGQFIEQYNEGQDVKEITNQLLSANKDHLSNLTIPAPFDPPFHFLLPPCSSKLTPSGISVYITKIPAS